VSTGLYLIDEGVVRLRGRTPGDGHVELACLGPGETVGEFSLLDGGPRSASAVADTAVSGWRIGRERFAALSASGDAAALAIMDRLRIEVAERTRVTVADIGGLLTTGVGTPRPLGTIPLSDPATPGAAVDSLLHSFPGFDRLNADDWHEFATITRRVDAPRGTLIADAGASPCHLVIVARGAVRVGVRHPAGGIEQTLMHGPGSFSGVAALLDGGLTGFVRDVREDAVLLLVDLAGFTHLRSGATPLGRRLFTAIGQQMVRDLRRLSRLLGRLREGVA
jgi:CRP-like cAMP-binding protein